MFVKILSYILNVFFNMITHYDIDDLDLCLELKILFIYLFLSFTSLIKYSNSHYNYKKYIIILQNLYITFVILLTSLIKIVFTPFF